MYASCITDANIVESYHLLSFLMHWVVSMVLGMHIPLATHETMPKCAILMLIAIVILWSTCM